MKKERIEDLGRLREKLSYLLEIDTFNEPSFLSKHNDADWYPSCNWKGTHEELIAYLEDRLDESRRTFMTIQEQLWDCFSIAKGDEDEVV